MRHEIGVYRPIEEWYSLSRTVRLKSQKEDEALCLVLFYVMGLFVHFRPKPHEHRRQLGAGKVSVVSMPKRENWSL